MEIIKLILIAFSVVYFGVMMSLIPSISRGLADYIDGGLEGARYHNEHPDAPLRMDRVQIHSENETSICLKIWSYDSDSWIISCSDKEVKNDE